MDMLEKLSLARTHLFLDHPEFGSLALNLQFNADNPTSAPMATDGTNCFYTESKIANWSEGELVFTIAHEALHCGFLHPYRMGSRDPQRSNRAMDYVINAQLIRSNVGTPPQGILYDPAYENMSFEQVYAKLLTDEQNAQQPKPPPPSDDTEEEDDDADNTGSADGNDGGDDDSASGDNGGDDSDSSEQEVDSDTDGSADDDADDSSGSAGSDAGDGSNGSDSTGDSGASAGAESSQVDDDAMPGAGASDVIPAQGTPGTSGAASDSGTLLPVSAPSQNEQIQSDDDADDDAAPADKPMSESDWQTATEQAFMVTKKAGKLSAELERAVAKTLAPESNLEEKLRQFIENCIPTDYMWRRPNKRMLAQANIYLPGIASDSMPPIAVAIDTSSSITQPMLDKFSALLEDVVRECRPREIKVIYCDAKVQHTVTYLPDDDLELKAYGGGGTAFQPVFDKIADEQDEYNEIAALVYITDGYGDNYRITDPDYPVLWVLPTWSEVIMPFGEQASVDIGRY